jgi:hypothetical protein
MQLPSSMVKASKNCVASGSASPKGTSLSESEMMTCAGTGPRSAMRGQGVGFAQRLHVGDGVLERHRAPFARDLRRQETEAQRQPFRTRGVPDHILKRHRLP